MSRTPEVEAAMRMAREGLNGEHIADTSKQTVAWTIGILAAEVEKLEADLKLLDHCLNVSETAHTMTGNQCAENLQRAEASEARARELEADLAQAQRWIRNNGQPRLDHACASCVPNGEIVKPGFVCASCKAALAETKGTT